MDAPKKLFLFLMTTTVLSVCFVFVLSLFVISKSIHQVTKEAEKNVKLEMFFKSDLNQEESSWVNSLKNKFEIQDIYLVSKAQAQNIFVDLMKSEWGTLAEDKNLLQNLPSSVIIQFQDDLKNLKIQQLSEAIVREAQQFESFDDHIFQKDWAQWFVTYKEFSIKVVLFAGGFMALLIFLVISNLNRSLIFQHLKEIEVLHLLGATQWQITKPFLLKSLALGALSSVVAFGLMTGLVRALVNHAQVNGSVISVGRIAVMNFQEFSIFLMFTLFVSLVSAHVCVRDQIR